MKRILAIAAVGILAQRSWAACNVIPDPKDQLMMGPNPTSEVITLATKIAEDNAKFGNALPHKGALGRIDRVDLTPARTDPIRVAADGRCVPDRSVRAFDLTKTDDLVATVIVGGAHGAQQPLVAGPKCEEVKARASEGGLRVVCAKGDLRLDDKLPSVLKLDLSRDLSAAGSGPARVVVFHAASSDIAARTLAKLTSTDCATLCQEDAEVAGLGVCIDDIFAPTGLAQNHIVYAAQDMVKCEVRTTAIPWNDFATQCQNGAGSSGLPSCRDAPTTLKLWEDGCHGVYVAFKWGDLLSAGANKWERQVRGQTVVSQKPKSPAEESEPRLWIPGPEFVGTLSEKDVTGSDPQFATDPRRAQLDVWFPNELELGIHGIADKPESIVHVVPRLAVSVVCTQNADEACMGVPTVPSIDATRCACRDRYAPDCTCETIVPAKFFQCSQSGMPCTRDTHCNPNELCNKQPTCQPEGTVWKKGGQNPVGPKVCWNDGHCKNETGATQCGYLLFDIHGIREANASDVVLDAKLSGAGARKRRGVCKKTGHGNARKECRNTSGNPACTAAEGSCAEYVLEALGGTKLP